jgi:hypothetical protein
VSKTICTLDQNRCDQHLLLSQGFTVVTNDSIVDYNRKVLGTIAVAAGRVGFECSFWSNSRPTNGPVNLSSVGVASVLSPINGTNSNVGGDTVSSTVDSCGLRPSDGSAGGGLAGIYRNNALVGSTFPNCFERQVISVLLDNTQSPPIVSFGVQGNYVGQSVLTAGLFYVPAVSIGCSAAAGDISAYLNFGQYRLEFPNMWINE